MMSGTIRRNRESAVSAGLAFVAGAVVVALPAFWLARLHRAHRDYHTAKAVVPRARATRRSAATSFLKFAFLAAAIVVAATLVESR